MKTTKRARAKLHVHRTIYIMQETVAHETPENEKTNDHLKNWT